MSNTGQELFELCKEVYKRTGWGDTGWWLNYVHALDGSWEWVKSHYEGGYERYPLYTSDYLLEKLPKGTHVAKGKQFRAWTMDEQGDYLDAYDGKTPTQALLKLVIALDNAGVKL